MAHIYTTIAELLRQFATAQVHSALSLTRHIKGVRVTSSLNQLLDLSLPSKVYLFLNNVERY